MSSWSLSSSGRRLAAFGLLPLVGSAALVAAEGKVLIAGGTSVGSHQLVVRATDGGQVSTTLQVSP